MVKTKQNTSNVKITVSPSGQRSVSSQSTMEKKKKKRNRKKSGPRKESLTSVSVAYSKRNQQGAVKTRPIENGILVDDSEFVSTLTTPANASNDPFILLKRLRINPLSTGTFTKLPSMAQNFEYYRFRKCQFRYETRCGSSQEGSLIMSPDYDAADGQVALNEKSIYGNKGSSDDAVWKQNIVKLDCKAMNRLYKSHACMSDARFATTKQDVKTIDAAQLFVCTDMAGLNSALTIGKLFVDYIVELTEPQAPTEPSDQGGGLIGTAVTQNSSQPIASGASLNAISEVPQNIFKAFNTLANLTYPSSTLLRFERDYKGVLEVVTGTGGSAISGGNPSFAIGESTSQNLPFGQATDKILPQANYFPIIKNAGQDQMRQTLSVDAVAGQLLRVGLAGVLNPTNMNLLLGGVSALF